MNKSPDKQRKALGRGLSALLPGRMAAAAPAPVQVEVAGTRVATIPISQIEPNPLQPRTTFDAAHLQDLANSI